MKNFLLAITAIFFVFTSNSFAQDLNKSWQFETIQNDAGEQLFSINKNADALDLKNGEFSYTLEAKNNLKASGDYIHQNNLLVFCKRRGGFIFSAPNPIAAAHTDRESSGTAVTTNGKCKTM